MTSILMSWRRARWAVAAAAIPMLWACNDRRLQAPGAGPEQVTDHHWVQSLNNDIDIVFMIDNSSSMDDEQTNLTKHFPTFMNVLKSLPGGLPDVHIGVISSSLGAGAFGDVPGCPSGGDRGAFQNAPRASSGACSAVPREGYIISLANGSMNNFPANADIAEVFGCIAELGVGGCGFEHQLSAVRRALGGDPKAPAPGENNGFLRDGAYLAVILITDEDDCSAPPDSDLFDPKQSSTSDPFGPLSSYRCNEFGHLCGSAKPPRQSAMNITDCHSAEDAGKLVKVADFIQFFKALKPLPRQFITAAIAGPPTPYSVQLNGQQQPEIAPSCTSANGAAFPGVRIKEFVDAFGQSGSFTSICTDSFAAAMDRIAMEIGDVLGPQCVDGIVLKADGSPIDTSTVADAQCQVVDRTQLSRDAFDERPIPNCAQSGPPCWKLSPNQDKCPTYGFELLIERGGAPPPANTTSSVKCLTRPSV